MKFYLFMRDLKADLVKRTHYKFTKLGGLEVQSGGRGSSANGNPVNTVHNKEKSYFLPMFSAKGLLHIDISTFC